MNKYFFQHSIVLLAITLIFGCAKKSDDDDSSSSASGSSAELVSAMPSNLAISSNTASGSSVASRIAIRSTKDIKDDSDPVRTRWKWSDQGSAKAESIDQCHKAIPKTWNIPEKCELLWSWTYVTNDDQTMTMISSTEIWYLTHIVIIVPRKAGQMNLLMKKTSKSSRWAFRRWWSSAKWRFEQASVGGGALDDGISQETKISDKRGGINHFRHPSKIIPPVEKLSGLESFRKF